MTIWVNEQVDPCGIVQACIASCNEEDAKACHRSFEADLDEQQKEMGWTARLRTVESWDDVPVTPLNLK